MAFALFVILLTLACVAACYFVAKKRGANPVFWVVMGAVFGPLALPFVFMAKPKDDNN